MASVSILHPGIAPERRLILQSAAAFSVVSLALIGYDGAIVWVARRASLAYAKAEEFHLELFSLPAHLTAMLGLSALAIGVAVLLVLLHSRLLALCTLIAVVAGPMAVIAAPIRISLVTEDPSGAKLWWHVMAEIPQFVILLLGTGWICRVLSRNEITANSGDSSTTAPRISSASLYGVVAAASILAQLVGRSELIGESTDLLTIIGWAALSGAAAVIVLRFPGHSASIGLFLSAAAVLTLLYAAYDRHGGWPGVAGWEYDGSSAPIILSLPASLSLLAAPLAGLTAATFSRRAPAALPG